MTSVDPSSDIHQIQEEALTPDVCYRSCDYTFVCSIRWMVSDEEYASVLGCLVAQMTRTEETAVRGYYLDIGERVQSWAQEVTALGMLKSGT